MNRKGFTLIELIAVILVLGIVLLLAAPTMTDAYKNSKLRSEEIFVDRLSQTIDSYIKLTSNDIDFTYDGKANKTEQNTLYSINIYKGSLTIQNIINDNLLSIEDYINAGNKELKCSQNAEIEVYKDSDYVYCHKVKKESLGCLSEEYKTSIAGDYAINTCIWTKEEDA